MDDALRAGVAVYNAGDYHDAHDAWEEAWLGLPEGDDDERFLHGLIQFTAAVHHARSGNWTGATGLAESAGEYLDGLATPYRGVDLAAVRSYLAALLRDPERAERARPPALTVEGRALAVADLSFEAATHVALLRAESDRYDAATVERAVEIAREEVAGGRRTRFTALVMDFAEDDAHRDLIYRRLADHVERRDRRRSDVEGLFD
jgi:predicted metal-dependent hydrolase